MAVVAAPPFTRTHVHQDARPAHRAPPSAWHRGQPGRTGRCGSRAAPVQTRSRTSRRARRRSARHRPRRRRRRPGAGPAARQPASARCWAARGGAWRARPAGLIIIIVCTLWTQAAILQPASAGCQDAARGELAGFIIIIVCYLLAAVRQTALAGRRTSARGELAVLITIVACPLLAAVQQPASAGCGCGRSFWLGDSLLNCMPPACQPSQLHTQPTHTRGRRHAGSSPASSSTALCKPPQRPAPGRRRGGTGCRRGGVGRASPRAHLRWHRPTRCLKSVGFSVGCT